jgi:energy-coupling factor transporter ATP-binding protein EcfA2
MPQDDFFTRYKQYVGLTECPDTYHRWSSISAVGTLLGRNFHLSHGHFTIYPNLYVMLIGEAGSRKSTAIKIAKKLIIATGYEHIAADKTTKEKFLLDLSGESDDGESGANGHDILESNLWGDNGGISTRAVAECYIMADEWNEFTSLGNIEFYSMLGNLWDYDGIYKNRIKTGKSVSINNPTISILAGNTATGFALAFPPEIIGQGFFSRLLLIHGSITGRKITFPKKPSEAATAEFAAYLQQIRTHCQGTATLTVGAERLLDKIYREYSGFDDVRFTSYMNRRFTQLMKLCLINAATRISRVIDEGDVVTANTVLTAAESRMPKALGEFGKGKHSDVANSIVEALSNTNSGLSFRELYTLVDHDLTSQTELSTILSNLRAAEKIQQAGKVFLVKKKVKLHVSDDTINYDLLTDEEKNL